MNKIRASISAVSVLVAAAVSSQALAATAPEASRLTSQYATWAGGKANADAIVNGLRTRGSVTLVTTGPDNTRSVAGFMPQTRMSDAEIASALAGARSSLSSLGIRQPNAEQIQAALIGGEVTLPDGRTRLLAGTVALAQEPVLSRVAAR